MDVWALGQRGDGSVKKNRMAFFINFSTVTILRFMPLKGTVRPDWICMRVVPLESPLKGHQPLYVFDFLISVLDI
jgi:hypothetical protein